MSNEVEKLVKKIQGETGKTQEEIAKAIGLSRSHFNQKVKGAHHDLREKLHKTFADILQQNVSTHQNGDVSIQMTGISVTMKDYIESLKEQKRIAEDNNLFLRDMMSRKMDLLDNKLTSASSVLQDNSHSLSMMTSQITGGLKELARVGAALEKKGEDFVKERINKDISDHRNVQKQKGKTAHIQGKG
jgi:transcriptional regulator with XRE-family HTH domain